jgi:dethiobiotin synthetase
MSNTYFITGTDTGIGKTFITCGLLSFLKSKNLKVVGLKPISAGVQIFNKQKLNEDVFLLKKYSNIELDYRDINYYSFDKPVSPHIVTAQENCPINFDLIKDNIKKIQSKADIVLIEGAGGYQVPIDVERRMSDLITYIDVPIILVVGVRLGCLNHTQLTYEAIKAKHNRIFGWIANIIEEDMLCVDENINYLKEKITEPCIGVVPKILSKMESINFADYFDWPGIE